MRQVKIDVSGNISVTKMGEETALQCKYKDRACGLSCVSVELVIKKGGFMITQCDKQAIHVLTADFETEMPLDLSKCTDTCADLECIHASLCAICADNKNRADKLKLQEELKEAERKEIADKDEKRAEKKALKLVKKNKNNKK